MSVDVAAVKLRAITGADHESRRRADRRAAREQRADRAVFVARAEAAGCTEYQAAMAWLWRQREPHIKLTADVMRKALHVLDGGDYWVDGKDENGGTR